MQFANFIPVTVIVAIGLFFIKEIVETFKKSKAEKRKLSAYKALISDEVEKNNWALKVIRRTTNTIKTGIETHTISIYSTSNGDKRVRFLEKGEDIKSASSWPIPLVHNAIFTKLISDIAQTDERFFNACTEAYSSVSELQHVRTSLLEYLIDENDEYGEGHLISFCDYAQRELADTYIALSKLYKECTGKDLENHKLRSFT